MSSNRSPSLVTVLIIIVVIIVIAAIIVLFMPDRQDTTSSNAIVIDSEVTRGSVPDMSSPYSGLNTPSIQSNTKFTTGLERLPRSLQGTDIDGEIIIDENKQLIVTEGLRRLFDYFLSALGEEDEATIIARVKGYILHHTPDPAASQAIAIFDKYVIYLKALSKIEERYGNLQLQATKEGALDLNVVAQRKQDISTLRQQHFDAVTITAFFGTEDDYDDYSIAMADIEQNKQLSNTQKSAARQDYISRMPDNATKQNIKQQANLGELMTRTEQMKAQGASSEALYNMRRELVGEAAAGRLATVDREDANFDQRFNQYQVQKQSILNQNVNSVQGQAQVTQLEQQLFSDTERKRLAGYAAMQQSDSK